MRKAVVYLVTNRVNGKTYVGVTRFNAARRWSQHCTKARAGVKTHLYSAIRKHGVESFHVSEVASCLRDPWAVERDVIQQLRPAYNQTNGGEHTTGRRVPRETVEKIAAGNRGQKRTPAQCARIAEAARQRSERPEWRAAVGAAAARARAKVDVAKRIAAAAKAARERVWTDESRAKLSASCMGRRHPSDVVERIAQRHRKRVRCVTTGQVFASAVEAGEALGIHNSTIGKACNGQLKTAHGLVFEFI